DGLNYFMRSVVHRVNRAPAVLYDAVSVRRAMRVRGHRCAVVCAICRVVVHVEPGGKVNEIERACPIRSRRRGWEASRRLQVSEVLLNLITGDAAGDTRIPI